MSGFPAQATRGGFPRRPGQSAARTLRRPAALAPPQPWPRQRETSSRQERGGWACVVCVHHGCRAVRGRRRPSGRACCCLFTLFLFSFSPGLHLSPSVLTSPSQRVSGYQLLQLLAVALSRFFVALIHQLHLVSLQLFVPHRREHHEALSG